ncbi:hypothetical protein AOQ84DRAFT_418841 [Glonium stellatum]|uniref:Fungal N-terminal domain-containing protein n=1 Tax=Glonium stellatum TaxID=574774 RepID=A0A8E2F927_9PEZI|nr:hypothetical protein AOQ84DRAFT_418841 [Glonium stellatum]
MSFGFSISDIITLTQLVTRTYNGWKNACGRYASITGDLALLQTIIVRVETEARSPTSLFTQNSEDLRQWAVLSRQCSAVVTELEDVLNKYKSLAPKNRHRNWERIRMGTKNFDDLHKRLVTRTESLSAFLTVLGLSSQGRVENNVLPEILRRFDDLAACSRTTNGSTQSSLTTYDDDDKEVWRRFRRDLIHSGFRSPDIEKYDAALKTYIGRLQRSGGLDEDEPGEVPLRLVIQAHFT